LLSRDVSIIENVPHLQDVRSFMLLLETLGARCTLENHVLTIDTRELTAHEAPYDLVRKMRASIYVLGPLLASGGRARVSLPGGCAWGPRPVNLHLEGMKALGAELELVEGYIEASCPGRLRGGRFRFEPSSVGGTANVLMAAVLAAGDVELDNTALEPEVTRLAEALVQAGARIEGIGTARLHVEGVESLGPIRHRVMADRIEAGTFLAAAAVTGGRIGLRGCEPGDLRAVSEILTEMGCEISGEGGVVTIRADGPHEPVQVVTRPYPGFPTDMQAQVMAACTLTPGTSHVTDTIYLDRFSHVAELRRLGADIEVAGPTATVRGVERLKGAPVMATDLRASAALVLAGIAAEGVTHVNRVYHIDRGYERIEAKLSALGARIRRERD
jgi:UDP-N-acetylglucosamine 1-carboxyvinyltransferase